ncbi:hypothetical protein C8R43DRAFT_967464 [Mycena crocata]|nr:hypothetical protein C8R43DRAFT_967464 [Mycena crocata]
MSLFVFRIARTRPLLDGLSKTKTLFHSSTPVSWKKKPKRAQETAPTPKPNSEEHNPLASSLLSDLILVQSTSSPSSRKPDKRRQKDSPTLLIRDVPPHVAAEDPAEGLAVVKQSSPQARSTDIAAPPSTILSGTTSTQSSPSASSRKSDKPRRKDSSTSIRDALPHVAVEGVAESLTVPKQSPPSPKKSNSAKTAAPASGILPDSVSKLSSPSPPSQNSSKTRRQKDPPFVRDSLPHVGVEAALELPNQPDGRNPSFRRRFRTEARNEQDWNMRTGKWTSSSSDVYYRGSGLGSHEGGPSRMGLPAGGRPQSYSLNPRSTWDRPEAITGSEAATRISMASSR